MELTDKVIKDLVKRRHPEYEKKKEHWDFISATYAGGRAWFDDNVFRYFKEGDQEYKERVERAYRFNHTREVVNLINKYIFREDIHRTEEDAPEFIRDFWRRATRQNVSVNEFMAAIDLQSSIYGRIWVVVDSTMEAGAESVEDQKKQDGRAYAYWISPQQMLDLAWDDDGNLLWALVVEVARDDADPFASTGQEFQRYRLWTQNEWYLFREEVKKGGQKGNAKVYLEDSGEHMHVAWQTELAVYRKGGMNIYGESKYQFVRSTKVGVVNFTEGVVRSSVRADSSGSRGKADVETFNAVLIVPLAADVKLGDVLVMSGTKLLVASVERRWGLRGRPGHLEVGANVWV